MSDLFQGNVPSTKQSFDDKKISHPTKCSVSRLLSSKDTKTLHPKKIILSPETKILNKYWQNQLLLVARNIVFYLSKWRKFSRRLLVPVCMPSRKVFIRVEINLIFWLKLWNFKIYYKYKFPAVIAGNLPSFRQVLIVWSVCKHSYNKAS